MKLMCISLAFICLFGFNNHSLANTLPIEDCPDLVISEITPIKQTEDFIQIKYTITNVGKGPIAFSKNGKKNVAFQIYYSADELLGMDDFLGESQFISPKSSLAPTQSLTKTLKIKLKDVTATDKFLIFQVSSRLIPECDGNNNSFPLSLNKPDLTPKVTKESKAEKALLAKAEKEKQEKEKAEKKRLKAEANKAKKELAKAKALEKRKIAAAKKAEKERLKQEKKAKEREAIVVHDIPSNVPLDKTPAPVEPQIELASDTLNTSEVDTVVSENTTQEPIDTVDTLTQSLPITESTTESDSISTTTPSESIAAVELTNVDSTDSVSDTIETQDKDLALPSPEAEIDSVSIETVTLVDSVSTDTSSLTVTLADSNTEMPATEDSLVTAQPNLQDSIPSEAVTLKPVSEDSTNTDVTVVEGLSDESIGAEREIVEVNPFSEDDGNDSGLSNVSANNSKKSEKSEIDLPTDSTIIVASKIEEDVPTKRKNDYVIASEREYDDDAFKQGPCTDLIITDIKIEKLSKYKAKLILTISNNGNAVANLYGEKGAKEDNVGWQAFLSGNERLGRGDLLTGGQHLVQLPSRGLLKPGKNIKVEIKIKMPNRTRYTPFLILKIDSQQLMHECDETNNVYPLQLKR